MLETRRTWPLAGVLETTDHLVVLLPRHVPGVEPDNDAHGTASVLGVGAPYRGDDGRADPPRALARLAVTFATSRKLGEPSLR